MALERGTWYVVYAWWTVGVPHERPDGGPVSGWYLAGDDPHDYAPQLHDARKFADLADAVAALLSFREHNSPRRIQIYRQVVDGTVRPLERVQ